MKLLIARSCTEARFTTNLPTWVNVDLKVPTVVSMGGLTVDLAGIARK